MFNPNNQLLLSDSIVLVLVYLVHNYPTHRYLSQFTDITTDIFFITLISYLLHQETVGQKSVLRPCPEKLGDRSLGRVCGCYLQNGFRVLVCLITKGKNTHTCSSINVLDQAL